MSAIIKGNFVGQPDGRFPVDVETFQQLQDYMDSVANCVNNVYIGGDMVEGYIISGCNLSANGTRREAGWLALNGMGLVYYEGGDGAEEEFSVEDILIDVVVDGVVYSAYTKRVAISGDTGRGSLFLWSDIGEKSSIDCPIGGAVVWMGKNQSIPQGWLLCDGRQYYISEYPALFRVIGYQWTPDGQEGGPVFNVPSFPYIGEIYHIIKAK